MHVGRTSYSSPISANESMFNQLTWRVVGACVSAETVLGWRSCSRLIFCIKLKLNHQSCLLSLQAAEDVVLNPTGRLRK